MTMPIEVEEVRRSGGAYAHVRAALEKEIELHRLYFRSTPFAMQAQVDDVRAGRPVRVSTRWLPPGASSVGADVVVVHPDDRVVETDDDWARVWLEEWDI